MRMPVICGWALLSNNRMTNVESGAVAASCELTAVHLDKVAHKAVPFPAAVREKAQALLVSGS